MIVVRNLSVASVSDGIGKTAFALALASIAENKGIEVGYMKPLGTRLRTRFGKPLDEDSVLAKRILNLKAEVEDLTPVIYSQTLIEQVIKGREDSKSLRNQIRGKHLQ